MLIRLILFLVTVWGITLAAIWLVGSLVQRWVKKVANSQNPSKPSQTNPPIESELVECQKCGLYVPANKAIQANNCYYCSIDCKNKE